MIEWRANNKGESAASIPKKDGNKKKKSRKEKIAAAVEKKFAEKLKEEEEKQVKEDEARAYIMGLLNLGSSIDNDEKSKVTIKPSNVASSQVTPKVTLHGILKNAKNQS